MSEVRVVRPRVSAIRLGLAIVTMAGAFGFASAGASSSPPADSEPSVSSSEPTLESAPSSTGDPVTSSEPSVATSSEAPVETEPATESSAPDTEPPVETSEPLLMLAAVAPAGPTEFVAPRSVVGDVTPDGRYVLVYSQLDGAATRIDLQGGSAVSSPLAGFLTDSGAAVIGLQYDRSTGSETLTRYDFASGTTQTYDLLPGEWIVAEITSISGDGRYLAVWASNPNFGDVGVFVIDTVTGTATQPDALAGNGGMQGSWDAQLSGDGSVVVFDNADSWIGCTSCIDVWAVRDNVAVLVSVSMTGGPSATGNSYVLDVTSDGRFVLFESTATDLAPGTATHEIRYYVRDLETGVTHLLPITHSVRSLVGARISADGQRIVFPMDGDIVVGDSQIVRAPLLGVFDRGTGETTQLLRGYDGSTAAGGELSSSLAIDALGELIVFDASVTNLVAQALDGVNAFLLRLMANVPPTTTTTTSPALPTTTQPGAATTAPATTGAATTTAPAPPGSTPAATAQAAHASLRPGEMQSVSASGFQPGEEVTGVQHSTPLALGTQVADASGRVTFSWRIRANETAGVHRVVLTGETSGSVEATFEVVSTPLVGTLPATR